MKARSFNTLEELAEYQAEREVREALRIELMSPEERYQWLTENWGRLQDAATELLAGKQCLPTARHYCSMEEKNRFDEERELQNALQYAIVQG
jgi:hypothetical protein